ncbi:MAG: hypothetical protein CBC35_00985 [Planctomycetes bacterium TMED75]|nr:hypothetical protein [Planctomycetaceae bacterium]OUU96492.1 MAG: hypothetical protein CBC35_00985 [Planctomycetes bacterium TMED75]
MLLAVAMSGWMPIESTAQTSEQDIEISLVTMGIDGFFKPGGVVPVRIALRSRLDEPTSVIAGFEVVNSDGDVERYTSSVVLSPGQSSRFWLYPNIAPYADLTNLREKVYQVVVFEDDEGQPGRRLASAPVSAASAEIPGAPVLMTEDLILVVGTSTMGLEGYQRTPGGGTEIPSLNTRCVIATVNPESLPDRARGLEAVEAITWSDASPTALGLEQAEALMGWIRSGGRLVIVLPEGSDPWSIGSRTRTALSALLPQVAPRRVENVPIKEMIQAISKSDGLRNPEAKSSLRLFDPQRLTEPWEPLAAVPKPRSRFETQLNQGSDDSIQGGLYAIQRRVEFGWIVLVGIDADALHRRQLQRGSLPQADVFWNRLLARRGSTPLPELYPVYANQELLRSGSTKTFGLGMGKLILESIKIGGTGVATWLLVVLVMFVVYGVLAGPASFWWLKRRGLIRYSWLVFLGFTLVFTGVSLAAARIGRSLISNQAPVRHLTFLDVIDGEPQARATSWFSAYLPEYGEAELSINDPKSRLATWSPPPQGSLESFPNSVVFEVNGPVNRLRVPSRGTSAHFKALWRGTLEGPWQDMPTSGEVPIRQLVYPTQPPGFAVEGIIRHGLPWDFTRLRMIQIGPIDNELPKYLNIDQTSRELPISPLPNPGVFLGIPPNQWRQGQALELQKLFPGRSQIANGELSDTALSLSKQMQDLYQRRVLSTLGDDLLGMNDAPDQLREEILEMYAFFRMLPQPVYLLEQPGWKNTAPALRMQRWLGAETDCSDWFIRPCIMLIGILEGVPCPVPIEIDGKSVESEGTVVLRWIHPLPVDEDFVITPTRTLAPLMLGPPSEETDDAKP